MIEGLITGILASTMFLGITLAVKQWLWPKYVAAMYEGSKIDGEWDIFYGGAKDASAVLSVKQLGNKITGTSRISKNKAGKVVNRRYKYNGIFLNNSTILIFEDEKHPLLMGGAMVLHHIDADAQIMRGKSIYFKTEIDDIDTSEIVLWKKS